MDEFRLVRLLKLLTQSIVAVPYVRLKDSFSKADFPIKDMTGMWSIDVYFKGKKSKIVIV